MRNPILPIVIAFVLALPCTALADKKKTNTTSSAGKQQYLQYNLNDTMVSHYSIGTHPPSGPRVHLHVPTTTVAPPRVK